MEICGFDVNTTKLSDLGGAVQGDRLGGFSKLVAHFHRKQVRGQDSIGKLQ